MPGTSTNVLLIESRPDIIARLSHSLRSDRWGRFSVHAVKTCDAALDTLSHSAFDVVLLSLTSVVGEVTDALKQLWRAAPDLPIIIWVDDADDPRIELGVQAGAQGVLFEQAGDSTTVARTIEAVVSRVRLERVERECEQLRAQAAQSDATLDTMARQYNSLVTALGVSLCRWLPDTTLVFTNELYRAIFGITDPTTNAKWLDLLPVESRAETAAFYEALVKEPRTVTYEHAVTIGGGELRHFHWIDAPIVGAQGELLEYQSIGIDITELKQTQTRLRHSEERYQSFVAQSHEAILRIELPEPIDASRSIDDQIELLKKNAFVAECNQAMASMYELPSPDALIGKTLSTLGGWEGTRERDERLRAFILSGYRSIDEEALEYTSSGRPLWLLRNTVGLVENGCLVRIWSTAIPITERKRTEEIIHAQRDLARIVGTVRSSEEAWPRCLDIAMRISGMDSGGFYLFDGDYQSLDLVYHQGLSDEFVNEVSKLSIESANAQAVLTGEILYVEQVGQNEFIHRNVEQIGAFASVPIIYQDRIIGCMNLASHTSRQVAAPARLALDTIASELGNIVVYLQTETALRESEARAKAMLNAIPDLMFRLNAQGVFLDYRAETRELYAQSTPSIVGKRNRDIAPPDFAELIDVMIRKTLDTGQLQTFEYELPLPGRGIHAYEARMTVSGSDEVMAIVQDITERKRAEDAIRYAEQRYRHMFEGAPIMYITTRNDDGVAVITDCNKLFLSTLGYTGAEVIGRRLHDFYTTESREKLEFGGYSTALQGETNIDERELLTRDGHVIPTLFKAVPVCDADGQLIGTQASYVDITDRKQAEEALKESNERFKQMADNIQEVFWMYDNRQQRIVYLSPAYEKIWGVTIEETYQDARHYINAIHPDDRNIMFVGLETQARGEPTTMEYRIVQPDGSIRWIHDRSFPIFDEAGRLHRTTGIAADFTARKKAETALRLSEEKYRGLIESLDSLVATVDHDGRYLYMNDRAAQQLGGEPSELIGASMFGLVSEPDASESMREIRAVIESGVARSYESPLRVNGNTRWHRTTIQPLRDEHDHVVCALINSTDVHDIKEAQQALLELNQLLEVRVRERTAEVQDLYDNAPTGYHSVDGNGRFLMINQTELSWLGYLREEVLGRSVHDFLAPESISIFERSLHTLIEQGAVRDIEMEMRRKDGSTMPVLVGATAIYDELGNFVMSRSTIFDNTERRKAEIALRDSEEQNRLLFEESPDPVILMTEGGTIVRANRANEELTLIPCDALIGSNILALGLVDEQTNTNIRNEIVRHIIENRESALAQYKLRRPDGSVRDVESRIFLVNIRGETQALTTTRDITAHKEAEETLRLANLEMQRALRLKDEFLANMSHELRTPLNGILALSEVLQEQIYGPLNERQLRSLRQVETSGRHLLELINDLLDLSKIDAGKLELDIAKVAADEICQASLMFVREIATKKRIKVQYHNQHANALLMADARRLKQMLVNLLSNAVKFTPEGGEVDLKVIVDPVENLVRFDVQDTGIGIAPADQHRLFQPFTQLDSALARQYEGTGLGLALVKRLAVQHGGAVSVQSSGVRGEGSCFSLILPSLPEKSTLGGEGTSATEEGGKPATLAPKSGPIILLVEDNEINIETVSGYLDYLGYRIVIARNGVEAIENAGTHRPALILMDIQLPVMDGIEAIRQLRQEPRFTTVPIIALTALAMSSDRERCLQAGATAYMSKPIRLTELANLIAQLLRP